MHARMASGRTTGYYITWFHRIFHATERGWQLARTPDDRPVMVQDAYFMRALEVIAQTLNLMMEEERGRNS